MAIPVHGQMEADEAIIEPRRGKGEEPVPPGIIMGFTPVDMALIRKGLGLEGRATRRVDLAKLWVCPPPSQEVALAGPAMGAPAAVLLLERLIALGAEAILGVGSCGSIQPKVSIGRVILPNGALIEEGTSPHYLASGVRTAPDADLLSSLREALQEAGVGPLEGRVWTTDAPFRETKGKVIAHQREGILGVDMEASALMTAASFRKVPFASLLVVSDELGSLKWKRGFGDPAYQDTLARVALIAARVLTDRAGAGVLGEDRGETG